MVDNEEELLKNTLHHRPTISSPGLNGLYWSSSSSLNSSSHDLSTLSSKSLSSSASSLASSIISGRWAKSRFNLTAECLRIERVSWAKFGSAVLNFTNSILGAGLMGIPYAMSKAGLIPGTILLILIAVISDWSVFLMIKSGKKVNADSYQELMKRAFGPVGAALSATFQAIFAFGCMCTYILIIAENLTRVIGFYLPESILRNRTLLIFLGNVLIVLPLSMARDVTFIGKVASLSVGGNLLIVIAVLFKSGSAALETMDEGYVLFSSSIIQAIGVISFSFVCHHNTFLIRESLEAKSSRLFSVVTSLSVGFSLLASLTLSIPAYIHFGSSTNPNILNSFGDDSSLINACRLLFACSLYVSYPLDCFVARDVLTRSLFPRTQQRMPKILHTGLTVVIVAATTAVCLRYEDLGLCLELTGGVSASTLAFIFPAAVYLKIGRKRGSNRLQTYLAITLLFFGCLVLLSAVVLPFIR